MKKKRISDLKTGNVVFNKIAHQLSKHIDFNSGGVSYLHGIASVKRMHGYQIDQPLERCMSLYPWGTIAGFHRCVG